MAFGPRLCAHCGSTQSIHEHHLVPRVHGGEQLPTVWLCAVHHGLVHGRELSTTRNDLIRAGLASARARGVKPGQKGYVRGNADLVALAKSLAADRTLLATSAALAEQGHLTATGRPFSASQVKRLIEAD